ncbi:hypothetical protein [Tenacibaculum sp. 190524A02b]|uniref:hypothetical protein n=1 Tax=Tenacibaculum vairaonense TaxID=3137860 RepID=UPI0031FA9048
MEIITINPFEAYTKLATKGYTEKDATNAIKDCNALVIDHKSKVCWFTVKEIASRIKSIVSVA